MTQTDTEVLPRLIRELREVRDRQNADKRRADDLRKHVEELLEDVGGEYVDEVAGLRAYIEKTPRWDYDPTALHSLVPAALTEAEFADCLRTIVDKKVVDGWMQSGLVTDRQITRANAKVGTKIVRTIQIKSIDKILAERKED